MVNSWNFSGRVGADAELRTTQSGEKVLSFRVANDVGFGDRKSTQWVDCSYWGKRGEAVANYVKRGDKVTVIGELTLREYRKKDGSPGSELSVRVNDMDLGSGPRDGAHEHNQDTRPPPSRGGHQGGNDRRGAPPPRDNRGGGKPAFDQDLDDEIPFVRESAMTNAREVRDEPKRMSSFDFVA